MKYQSIVLQISSLVLALALVPAAFAKAHAGLQQEVTLPIQAKALVALPGMAANKNGSLTFGPSSLRFASEQDHEDIARQNIIAISTGDERIETGGKPGRAARMLIPYGGGLLLGTVTHKKVGLITVDYLDNAGEYHAAVFVVAQEDLARTPGEYAVASAETPNPRPSVSCPVLQIRKNTVDVAVIEADATSAFPPEDRAMLYESLVRQLQAEKTITKVYRAGDRSPGAECAEFTVGVRAVTFHKGDQAVRASVGPLSHFVGTTKLAYHLTVTTQSGITIVDRDMKASEGSDTDSLNLSKVISKAVLKNLKTSSKKMQREEAL